MSNVELRIGGRSYTVACADGEEAHVMELGRVVDAGATASGAMAQSETRMLLFASLMLADELHEARRELALAADASERDIAAAGMLQERIDAIADRLETLAGRLDSATS